MNERNIEAERYFPERDENIKIAEESNRHLIKVNDSMGLIMQQHRDQSS